jgi:3-oxoacyl-[acyl-carrier-protein] synthase III
MSLRGRAAIVGVAESDLGEVGADFTPLDLIGQAASRALEDAGLEKEDVDGLFSASAYYTCPPSAWASTSASETRCENAPTLKVVTVK